MSDPHSNDDGNSTYKTARCPENEQRPERCQTLRSLLAASASAEDLRSPVLEKDTQYCSSPRGVLEGCKSNVGSDTDSPLQENRSHLSQTAKPLSHWKKVVQRWKVKSLKHLHSIPRISGRKSKREEGYDHDDDDDLESSLDANLCYYKPSWKIFSFVELVVATNGFGEDCLIGKGGSGDVYKGCLPDGQLVAIKRITKGSNNEQNASFLSELGVLVHVDHHNIAKLIGYGVDGGVHLVFELSSRGSLGNFLRDSGEHLDWASRYNIALGIAEGLVYLHEECEKRIIHRDIKSDNILLAENYDPQICDFGTAMWLPRQQTHYTVTKQEGTFGYIAPEYLMQGLVDEKTDVFAFGVVLLELITGRPALDDSRQSILIWAKPLMHKNQLSSLVDPCLGDNYDKKELERVVVTAALCVDASRCIRPPMSQKEKLESRSQWLQVVVLLKGDEYAQAMGKQTLKRTFSEELLDAKQYNSTKYLNELRRHKQVAFDFYSDLSSMSPRSPQNPAASLL